MEKKNETKKKVVNKEKEYSKLFKTCTDIFVKELETKIDNIDIPSFTLYDITYADGYFIFNFGKNSIVHFRVKECPGWLFGIWWNEPQVICKNTKTGKKYEEKRVTGEFFGQYEDSIDKFKPAASNIQGTIFFNLLDNDFDVESAFNSIDFIANEPALAFCRDYFDYDYNVEHLTRKEADKKFKEYKKRKKTEDKYNKILDDKILNFIKKEVLPFYKNAEIADCGENFSPRYVLRAPLSLNKDLFEEHGHYDIEKEFKDKFIKIQDKCNKIANRHKIYWSRPIRPDVFIYDDQQSKKKSKKSDKKAK